MQFLSYNLLKHQAVAEVTGLAKKFTPDAFCIQETNVLELPKRFGDLELVIGTEKNRLGLAVYVDTNKYHVEDAASFKLRDGYYDLIAAPAHERLLGVLMSDKSSSEKVAVGSFHASPLTALNAIRREQIHAGLKNLDELGKGSPLMMLGDFNYPVFRHRLAREIAAGGYRLHTSDQQTYNHFKFVRGYFDFAVSRGFKNASLRTLKQGSSDHLPILAQVNDLSGVAIS